MSEPFEAAVRGRCNGDCAYPACACNGPYRRKMEDDTRNVLAAAFPPDPAPETLQAMLDGYMGPNGKLEGAYRAFRASLLLGEEPS